MVNIIQTSLIIVVSVLAVLIQVVLILAIRNGRIKELGMSYEKTLCAETGRSLEELEREEAEMPVAHPLLDHTVLTGLIVAGISLLIQVILTEAVL